MSRFVPTPAADALVAHPRLLAERDELAYAVRNDRAEPFARAVDRRLCRVNDRIADNPVPTSHYVATLYFDSAAHEIARACAGGLDHVKLRAREYSDRGEGSVTTEPLWWLEVKTRVGTRTTKLRFSIPVGEVSRFFARGVITAPLIAKQRARWGASADAVLRAIVELCRATGSPLRPTCVAHYRRRAWQHPEGLLRVTLDTELGFCRPPADLFGAGLSLSEVVARQEPVRAEHSIIEVKLRRDCPAWLRELLAGLGIGSDAGQPPYSKFLAALRAVGVAP